MRSAAAPQCEAPPRPRCARAAGRTNARDRDVRARGRRRRRAARHHRHSQSLRRAARSRRRARNTTQRPRPLLWRSAAAPRHPRDRSVRVPRSCPSGRRRSVRRRPRRPPRASHARLTQQHSCEGALECGVTVAQHGLAVRDEHHLHGRVEQRPQPSAGPPACSRRGGAATTPDTCGGPAAGRRGCGHRARAHRAPGSRRSSRPHPGSRRPRHLRARWSTRRSAGSAPRGSARAT